PCFRAPLYVVLTTYNLMIVIPDRYFLYYFYPSTSSISTYLLSLHDALPISPGATPCRPRASRRSSSVRPGSPDAAARAPSMRRRDRKSTRLNSSHVKISYAVFCLKKKNNTIKNNTRRSATTNRAILERSE